MTPLRKLEIVREELGDCRRCGLCETRKNIVFGVGTASTPLVFVGEGPGADEDEQGLPFVGAAGQLLTKMIEAMGWTRDTVYICNVIKCRPTNDDGQNRPGSPEEVAACLPFLMKQLDTIAPLVVVTLGNLATKTLLKTETGITRMRGKWEKLLVSRDHEVRVMPTFHPANLLRDPYNKKLVWKDLQAVIKVLEADGHTSPNPSWVKRERGRGRVGNRL
jgi:uracil-DNA glycosylase